MGTPPSAERPGLKRLLADVAAGKVQVTVLYKIDRIVVRLGDEIVAEHARFFGRCSPAIRTARSPTSEENLFIVLHRRSFS